MRPATAARELLPKGWKRHEKMKICCWIPQHSTAPDLFQLSQYVSVCITKFDNSSDSQIFPEFLCVFPKVPTYSHSLRLRGQHSSTVFHNGHHNLSAPVSFASCRHCFKFFLQDALVLDLVMETQEITVLVGTSLLKLKLALDINLSFWDLGDGT